MNSKNGSGAGRRWNLARGASALAAAAAAMGGAPALAQDADDGETIVVTGTRITLPGLESASPISTVGAEEIALQNEPEVERILATMPSVLAADGQNRNNGTSGAATINLRGLGAQRNLIMIDGRRLVPFDMNGIVDLQQVPAAFVERIDVVTGGASAVYGSDAISGAVNFITRRDFEGVELDYNRSITAEDDGEINAVSLSLGAGLGEGRGNAALNMNYSIRDGVQLGARPLGRLGIDTESGANFDRFRAGEGATLPADPLCQGENAVAAGGSTTTFPTRVAVPGSPAFRNAGIQQFRTDGSIGANCSVFNFNPYNYYQTPQERFGATALASYDVNDQLEIYGRFTFANSRVRQQIAPSGVFGSLFWTNMDNPLIQGDVRTAMIAAAEAERTATIPTIGTSNWRDNDGTGTVTAPDDLLISYRRRTVEFGPRSTTFDSDTYQLAAGVRGEIGDTGWDYDAYFSQGGVGRTEVNAGYTNVTHLAEQMLTTDGVTCRDSSDPACVPINFFGPTITDPAAIAYGSAAALQTVDTRQTIFNATLSGFLPGTLGPWASTPAGVSFGYEYRSESMEFMPDECLRVRPASCLGGAGGYVLPFAKDFDVHELFAEAIAPLAEDQPFVRSLSVELGYRIADYSVGGENETYKYGLNWEPTDGLRFRAMRQRAARAPNLGELFTPILSGLANATFDPCSIANADAFPDPTLEALCISTGMTAGQVGVVADGVIAGQLHIFYGTNPTAPLPEPEIADTTTVGIIWSPSLPPGLNIVNPAITLDWYNIEVENFIGSFGGQEVLDSCYGQGIAEMCSRIRRVSGELGLPGAGVELFTENLLSAQAEGLELGAAFSVDLGGLGTLDFAFNANKYLTQESRSSDFLDTVECVGYFGNQCGNPLPEYRWIQRTSWNIGDWTLSYLWRHLGEANAEQAQVDSTFPAFRQIDAYDYVDLSAQWDVTSSLRFDAMIRNATDEDPPVVGNEAGTTSANSGNTFPAVYDTLGSVYAVGFNLRF